MFIESAANKQLDLLQNSKGKVCVSIILPTHRLSPDRRVDQLNLKKSINSAKQLLKFKYTVSNIEILLDSIDEIFENIDFSHNSLGLGIFISSDVKLAVQFPFTVEEKVLVGDSFEIRDLLYKENYSIPYLVISLSKNSIRLFTGILDELKEVIDINFPLTYEEEYLYNPPSRGTPFTGHTTVRNFEKEKTNMQEIRFKQFYHKADKLLNQYVNTGLPILLLGVQKDIAWFEEVSSYAENFIQSITGNYDSFNEKQLTDISWPVMFEHLQHQRKLLVKELDEKVGSHLVITGIQHIWQATKDGKAFKLLVEKDFRKSGFITDGGYQFHERPTDKAYKIITDAVDDIMEMVLDSGGQVFLTDNNLLKDYQHIALITRY